MILKSFLGLSHRSYSFIFESWANFEILLGSVELFWNILDLMPFSKVLLRISGNDLSNLLNVIEFPWRRFWRVLTASWRLFENVKDSLDLSRDSLCIQFKLVASIWKFLKETWNELQICQIQLHLQESSSWTVYRCIKWIKSKNNIKNSKEVWNRWTISTNFESKISDKWIRISESFKNLQVWHLTMSDSKLRINNIFIRDPDNLESGEIFLKLFQSPFKPNE